MSEPLALSDEQLQTVTAAAALLRPRDRCGAMTRPMEVREEDRSAYGGRGVDSEGV
jgi:hypothetical protein